MLLSMLLAGQAQEVIVRSVELRPADPWVEVFSASCGQQHLEVRRPMRPIQTGARVLLNGQRAGGDVGPLEMDLGEVGAAYRISFQCSQDGDTIQLRWVSGLVGERGEVRYRAGSAELRQGALVRSLSEETDEQAFWYR